MNKYLLLLSLMIFIFTGCKQQISGQDFEKILSDSKNHSAVSYWYAGEKDGIYYIQERWPLPSKTKMFQISQDQIII